jgi:hypothetical protein
LNLVESLIEKNYVENLFITGLSMGGAVGAIATILLNKRNIPC